jgi:hypothetical protein
MHATKPNILFTFLSPHFHLPVLLLSQIPEGQLRSDYLTLVRAYSRRVHLTPRNSSHNKELCSVFDF